MSYSYKTRNNSSGDILSYYSANSINGISVSVLKDIISNKILAPRFRFHWLNPDETVKTDIPEEDIILGGSYNENYQNGQRRNISFSLYNYTGKYTPSINNLWKGTKFSFECGLEIDDVGTVIWFPKGIYVVTNISVSEDSSQKNVSVEMADKFAVLTGKTGTLETTYTIGPNRLISDIVKDILKTDLGNDSQLDPKTFILDNALKGKKTQATISKSAGDTFGAIILELATQMSAEVFYDVEGHLTFVPIDYVSKDVDKPILYQFYDYQGDFGSNNLTFDFDGIINRIIVIGNNINGGVCRATAVNDDPSSPLCYQRIGYHTGSPINDNNITSNILAQERADYELRNKLILRSTASNLVRFNPLLLVNNLVGVTDEFYGFNQEKFLLQSISYSIDYSGSMSISSSNARNLPFVVGG